MSCGVADSELCFRKVSRDVRRMLSKGEAGRPVKVLFPWGRGALMGCKRAVVVG